MTIPICPTCSLPVTTEHVSHCSLCGLPRGDGLELCPYHTFPDAATSWEDHGGESG